MYRNLFWYSLEEIKVKEFENEFNLTEVEKDKKSKGLQYLAKIKQDTVDQMSDTNEEN